MKRRGSRSSVLAIAIRTSLVLAVAAAWPGVPTEAQAGPAASTLPQHLDAETKVYVKLGPDLLAALARAEPERLPASVRPFAPAMRGLLFDAGIRPADLAPWLGSEAALAIADADPATRARRARERLARAGKAAAQARRSGAKLQPTVADPGPAPGDDSEVLGVIASRDDARAAAFLRRFAARHEYSAVRSGVPGLTEFRTGSGEGSRYFAAGKGFVAFSSSKPLLESVFGRKPRRSLAATPEFRYLTGKLPPGGLAEVYIDLRFVSSLKNTRTTRAAGRLGDSEFFSKLQGWKGLAGSLRAEDSGLGLEMLMHSDPMAVAEFADSPPLSQAVLDGVSANALGFMAFHVPRGFYEEILSGLGDSLAALEGGDIDLGRDVFSWLGGEVSLVVVPAGATRGIFPVGAYFSVATTQPSAAATGMRKLSEAAADLLGPEVVFEIRSIAGKDWTVLRSGESGPALGGYAIDPSGLRVALGQAGLEEAASHSAITSATSYRAVVAHLSPRSTSLAYVDVAGSLGVARRLLKPAEQAEWDEEIGPVLGKLDALAVSGAFPLVDKDGLMRMSAFLTVKP